MRTMFNRLLGRTPREFKIEARWDAEAEVWYVHESNVPGLVTEAPTLEELASKLHHMIPELLVLNGVIKPPGEQLIEVPFELMARQHQMARTGC